MPERSSVRTQSTVRDLTLRAMVTTGSLAASAVNARVADRGPSRMTASQRSSRTASIAHVSGRVGAIALSTTSYPAGSAAA